MIAIKNISVIYRVAEKEIPALSSFSLDIDKSEYVAVMGPNGSGKSTLIKALCGLIGIDDGEIVLLDKAVRPGNFGEDFFGKVGAVFQEPEGQFLMRDVKTEIVSVLQNLGLPYKQQQEKLAAIVKDFDLEEILMHKPSELSGGQMQIVNLACALAFEPEVLLLDEPTTYLDRHYQKAFLDRLDSLHDSGMTILHVTQFASEVARSNRICIVENGNVAFDGTPNEILHNNELVKKYDLILPAQASIKGKVFWFGPGKKPSKTDTWPNFREKEISGNTLDSSQIQKRPILSLKKLSYKYPDSGFTLVVDNLEILRGEIVGLLGETGSGKSTLAFLMAGLITAYTGKIEFDSKSLMEYSIKELRAKIGISWQLSDLALLGPTVKDDIEFGLNNLGISNVDIEALLERVRLKGFAERIVDTLSGGEKRKLSLAGIMAIDPELYILDEPTAFLDPHSQLELTDIIGQLRSRGKTILIAGHDLSFISKLTKRIVGIKSGRLIYDLPDGGFFSIRK